ncbi:hypothetical protein [Paractinoplanes atraurantiacus]|uniref:Uncharacterized protein n=1 Tax=Paractinoplanes atraurantiacus TaxID=1036182 RepID=A0A285JFL8_9ACTN|nr:hypothetical protein [Actinoplanes atraurantiacus]SNY59089.1 hypothetical protein SAMN05421748_12029 [Actinoplanes atraurantiacus]
MTTASSKTVRAVPPAKPDTHPEDRRVRTRRIGREIGILAVNVYERGVFDVVAFEKDAAKIAPYPWMRSVLATSAGLVEDVGAAYVKTARQVLR